MRRDNKGGRGAMREILFRGKRVDNGEWVYGAYYGLCRMMNKAGDFGYAHLIRQSNDEPLYRVDPETVGEYTGLTDKNGKRIFEGDILSDGDDTYKVVFEDGIFQIDNSHYITGLYVAIHTEKIDEVIGTIYDNPELLEVKE